MIQAGCQSKRLDRSEIQKGIKMKEEIRVKSRWRDESDNWTKKASKIVDLSKLKAIEHVLETKGCIIVEHWIYRGSSAPNRLIFDDFDDFYQYLKTKTNAGDQIDAWSMHDLCLSGNRIAEGKVPDLDGCVPEGGVY